MCRARRVDILAIVDHLRPSFCSRSWNWVCCGSLTKVPIYVIATRYFASGTGGAGLVGAFLWWELRRLGVRVGVGLSSVCRFL